MNKISARLLCKLGDESCRISCIKVVAKENAFSSVDAVLLGVFDFFFLSFYESLLMFLKRPLSP